MKVQWRFMTVKSNGRWGRQEKGGKNFGRTFVNYVRYSPCSSPSQKMVLPRTQGSGPKLISTSFSTCSTCSLSHLSPYSIPPLISAPISSACSSALSRAPIMSFHCSCLSAAAILSPYNPSSTTARRMISKSK